MRFENKWGSETNLWSGFGIGLDRQLVHARPKGGWLFTIRRLAGGSRHSDLNSHRSTVSTTSFSRSSLMRSRYTPAIVLSTWPMMALTAT